MGLVQELSNNKTNNAAYSPVLPGLYQSASAASMEAQKIYFWSLRCYLILLISAAIASYIGVKNVDSAIISAFLFFITLGILVFLRINRPEDTWYNGRAVAESVKTRAWRYMMRAEPYHDQGNLEITSKELISDLRTILEQNTSLSKSLQAGESAKDPISSSMRDIRLSPVEERLHTYIECRITDQAQWYWKKSKYNKRRARFWFWIGCALHIVAILLLLYRIKTPTLNYPVEVIATCIGAVYTWLQAKKHNELNSAYALAAHEIVLIKGESASVKTAEDLSEFVLNSEAAFSREHTQWVARKSS